MLVQFAGVGIYLPIYYTVYTYLSEPEIYCHMSGAQSAYTEIIASLPIGRGYLIKQFLWTYSSEGHEAGARTEYRQNQINLSFLVYI
jgi:hypothetical protein